MSNPIYSTERVIPRKKKRRRIGEIPADKQRYLRDLTAWERIQLDVKLAKLRTQLAAA